MGDVILLNGRVPRYAARFFVKRPVGLRSSWHLGIDVLQSAILMSERSFKPEVIPAFESYIKIGHTTPYILSFWSTLYLKF